MPLFLFISNALQVHGWELARILLSASKRIASMIQVVNKTIPCFACHWTSASSFLANRGISASNPK